MKLLVSPSISSSSTAYFDANMCTSKSATASCLAGILRRIFCSHSLPTHPSDQTTETSSVLCDNKHQELVMSNEKSEGTATTTPGVVARLMGLESLPDKFSVGVQAGGNSISRSRSMNSVEFRGESDQIQGQHRRLRSTLSFREMPTFLEVENEEFFVLSFQGGSQSGEFGGEGRKYDVGSGELKERNVEKCRRSKGSRRGKIVLEKKEDEEITKKMVVEIPNAEEFSKKFSDKPNQEAGNGSRKIEDASFTTSPLNNSSEKTNAALQDSKRSNSSRYTEVSHGSKLRKKKKVNLSANKNQEPKSSSEDSSPVSVLDSGQFIIDTEARTSGFSHKFSSNLVFWNIQLFDSISY